MRKQNAGWFEFGAMCAFVLLFLVAGYEAEARTEAVEIDQEEQIALRIYEEERDACYRTCSGTCQTVTECEESCELCPE